MRILVIMNSSNVKLGGGIIQLVLSYKKELLKVDEENISMDFAINTVVSSKIPQILEDDKCNFFWIPNKKKNIVSYIKSINKIMYQKHYDVVHVHGNSANMALELLIAKKNKVNNRIAHCHNSRCSHPIFNKLITPIFKNTYTKAIACSELAGDWLFGKNNFYVLDNAIQINDYLYNENIRNEYRKKLNVNEDTVVLGHVGNINQQKNHKFMLKVFKEYLKEKENSILIFIGEGPLHSEIEKISKEYQIEKKIFFLGVRDDVNKWMQAMDVFLFPSLWEGFGLVAIEAQASGLPVIASKAVPDSIKIDKMFFLETNEDNILEWKYKILDLVKDKESRKIEIKNFEKYNIQNQAKKLIKIYQKKN